MGNYLKKLQKNFFSYNIFQFNTISSICELSTWDVMQGEHFRKSFGYTAIHSETRERIVLQIIFKKSSFDFRCC